MKLLCDQMLVRLGRWLRAAGYDTEIVTESIKDEQILLQARQQNRILITRDSYFEQISQMQDEVVFLHANEVSDCIQELTLKLKINWLLAPFTRCLMCNAQLVTPPPSQKQVPDDVLKTSEQLWYCPRCDKVYWHGSHTKRMLSQLEKWLERSVH